MEMLDEIDKKIIRAMQGDFPLVEEPYKEIAAIVGVEEAELLRRLCRLKENGRSARWGLSFSTALRDSRRMSCALGSCRPHAWMRSRDVCAKTLRYRIVMTATPQRIGRTTSTR